MTLANCCLCGNRWRLRSLADAYDTLKQQEALLNAKQFDALMGAFVNAWRRGYANTMAVMLKATSSAGRLASVLLQCEPSARAIYVNVRPEPYLATLLAGANSSLDLRGHGAARMRRLLPRIGSPLAPLHELSPGQLAAMSWLVETLSQQDCHRRDPARVLAVDFEQFLTDVPAALSTIWTHLSAAWHATIGCVQIADYTGTLFKSAATRRIRRRCAPNC